MQYTRFFLWLFALSFVLASCVTPPDYPDEPMIAYEGVSKNTIYQFTNGPTDSITIQFSFTDGDGDISSTDSTDIYIRDSRFPNIPPTIIGAFPPIPTEGTGNGISGDVYFTIINSGQAVCCVFNNTFCEVDTRYPVDSLFYSIYIIDRAGNRSNTIQTEQIQILCLGQ